MSKEQENKCDCISLNRPQDYQKTSSRKLDPNKYFNWDSKAKDVYVDECIADQVIKLWENGIWTGGSCCGHNGEFPRCIVLSSNKKSDARKAQALLPDIEILYWDLVAHKEDNNYKSGLRNNA